jgi:CBS domain-containing protein
MLIKEVMTPFAETIGSEESIEAAARKMKGLGIGALAVCEHDVVIGIVTDRDIVVRSVAAGEDPVRASVREAMTPLVISCSEEDELEHAARVMEDRAVRRLFVLDDAGRPVGVVSVDDLALENAALAGDVVVHARMPGRATRVTWPWWE